MDSTGDYDNDQGDGPDDNGPDRDLERPDGDYGGQNRRCKQYCSERYSLEQRIASGQSDRYYKKWAEIRGEKYITHDSERLEYVEDRIADLSCGC
ncbi:MAG: hypothetical protein SWH68_01350 [Thermodesulfobacteriota bacterium]|nr:hypothetical protein [Thermodesulfobacteriota bacterium]